MRYIFSAVFEDGAIEPGGGDAWAVLRILKVKRQRGGFTLSAIVDRETGHGVTESDIAASLRIVD